MRSIYHGSGSGTVNGTGVTGTQSVINKGSGSALSRLPF
jgi:hypothetical protein